MSNLDPNGLRRRSPNPNSPIPYSPALLSPYIPSQYQWPERHSRHLTEGRTPTIRLVNSTSGNEDDGYGYRYAPRASRTQSDDRHLRASTIASSVANLRRHGTEPRYPSRNEDEREWREREVPPLPLNVIKDPSSRGITNPYSSRPPSLVGGYDDRNQEKSRRYLDSPEAKSIGGRSFVDSLKSLANPFTKHHPHPYPQSIPLSRNSSKESKSSDKSYISSSSRSSTSTIAVPFYPGAYWKNAGTSKESLSSNRGSIVGLPDKFPQRPLERTRERWTSFKIVLMISVFVVS